MYGAGAVILLGGFQNVSHGNQRHKHAFHVQIFTHAANHKAVAVTRHLSSTFLQRQIWEFGHVALQCLLAAGFAVGLVWVFLP